MCKRQHHQAILLSLQSHDSRVAQNVTRHYQNGDNKQQVWKKARQEDNELWTMCYIEAKWDYCDTIMQKNFNFLNISFCKHCKIGTFAIFHYFSQPFFTDGCCFSLLYFLFLANSHLRKKTRQISIVDISKYLILGILLANTKKR